MGFEQILAHCGIRGNEMVDNIAKKAKTVTTLFWHLALAKDKSTVNKKGVNVAKVLQCYTKLKEQLKII